MYLGLRLSLTYAVKNSSVIYGLVKEILILVDLDTLKLVRTCKEALVGCGSRDGSCIHKCH